MDQRTKNPDVPSAEEQEGMLTVNKETLQDLDAPGAPGADAIKGGRPPESQYCTWGCSEGCGSHTCA